METEISFESDRLEVSRFVTGPLDNNVYFLRCKATGQSIMIDAPGGNPELLVATCFSRDINTVLATHGHHDHVGAIPVLRSARIRVGIGALDADMAATPTDFTIADGDAFTVGELSVKAIATPGHTPGSTCFAIDEVLFSGDTLFPGGPGATRWPYSSFETIMRSLETRLFTLDDETVVLCGHGDSTTIGAERPNLALWKSRRW